jgi:epoxyqueuosine reductase
MSPGEEVVARIRNAALEEGFDGLAVAAVQQLPAADRLRRWLDRGMHGSMAWLEHNVDRRTRPAEVVPDARSVIVVSRRYWGGDPIALDSRTARISRYAWGVDYHDVLDAPIRALYRRLEEIVPGIAGRYYVDTGPVMEKVWAQLGGLGWIGKHTNLITVGEGSWFFLGAIIVDAELTAGSPARDHCGTCTACIDVCPTRAIVAPYVLDARLCIAYQTIENRGPIPRELRAAIGNHVFGCDDCQDVCPWNRFARVTAGAAAFAPREGLAAPDLVELMTLDAAGFAARFRGTPVKRAKRRGLLRNVAIALGNSGDPEVVPALVLAMADAEPLVRGHAAWALGHIGGTPALDGLRDRLREETDSWVIDELTAAIAEANRA